MNKLYHVGIVVAVLVLPMQSWGLSSDREQPMQIEADHAQMDDNKGTSIYRGNVKVTQGTLVLTGDVMTVYDKGGEVQKVIMDGTPATYRQRPDGKDEDVHAKSLRMEYYTTPERIILLKQAEVWQSGDVLRSEKIVYDVVNDLVNAGTQKPDERVHITIQPKPKPKKTENEAETTSP